LDTWEGSEDVSQVTGNVPPTVHVESYVGEVIQGAQTSCITGETEPENAQERSARRMMREERRTQGEVFMGMMTSH